MPVPVPGRARPARAARARTAGIAFSDAQRAVVEAFGRSGETRADVAALLESGRELAPELLNAPFDLVGIRCPVLLVWGAYDRDAPAQRRADGARRAAHHRRSS